MRGTQPELASEVNPLSQRQQALAVRGTTSSMPLSARPSHNASRSWQCMGLPHAC